MQSVSANSQQTKLLQDSLRAIPGAARRAGARAVNYVTSGGRKEVPRWVGVKYAIPQSKILPLLTAEKATASMSVATAALVGVGKKGQPLLDFAVGNKSAPSTRRTSGGGYTPAPGISVLIKRGSGKKAVPGAFIAKMESGKELVGIRTGEKRRQNITYAGKKRAAKTPPLKDRFRAQYLPSPIQLLEQQEYKKMWDSYVDKAMPDALAREIDRELK